MTLSRQNSLTQYGQGGILGMDSTRPRALRFPAQHAKIARVGGPGFAGRSDKKQAAIFKN
jgi:hypothetical protein